ncbi:uncharacterized protein [Watersipora subatra]|uniref:uncharacterized protein n=1 Tax=Watersipora subatra TaxID=2589382 RepID=UPI00355BF821
MVDEGQRRRTFQTQWPHDGTLSGTKMAEAGIYYLEEGDQVQCVFCRGMLRNWSEHEVPMTEHAQFFNFCQFVKGLNCRNREYRSKKVASEDMANITVFGNLTDAEQKQQQESGADSGPLGVGTNRAGIIKYAPDSARLRTFQRWPASSPFNEEQVCEAGFYYTGFGDQVRCFYCLGITKGTPDNKKCTTKTKMQKRAEQKKKAAISEQEAMPEICEKLGHDRQRVAKALAYNSNHFESVKDMLTSSEIHQEIQSCLEIANTGRRNCIDIHFILQTAFTAAIEQRTLRKEMLYFERQVIHQREQSLNSYQWTTDCFTIGLDLPLTFFAIIRFVVTVAQLLGKYSANVRCLTWFVHLSNRIKKIASIWPINQHGSSAKISKQSQLVVDYSHTAQYASTKEISKEVDEPDELFNETRWMRNSNWVKKPNLWVCTAAQYPENHNPAIPLTLQKELDQKTPKEYLCYINNDLTTEERESLMVDEGQRRRTFQIKWPHYGTLSGTKMAEAGFYYLGEGDQVQCAFCRGRLRNWSQHEVPMTEHARLFNFCQFVKGLNCGNREYRSKKIASEDMANITVFGNLTDAEQKQQQESGTDSGPLGICTNRAAVIKYAPDSVRLRTFQRWPASSPLTGEQVCEAGFYYTGFDDQVRCFYCLGGIKGWTAHDEPWEEHARWFPDCSYLLNKKGIEYVDLVYQRTPDNKKCTTKTKLQKRAEWKKKAAISEQEAMPEICEKLGHDRQTIAKALAANNQFESVKDMVNAVHALEDAGEEPIRQGEITPKSGAASHPLQEHNPPAQQPTDQQLGQLQQSERRTKHKAGCRICELKTTNFVPATNVGLPCGHLIYCDSCKTDESKKSVIQLIKCPYSGCNSPLAGTIKVFYA